MLWAWFGKFLSALNLTAALLIVAIMALICADVIGRTLFDAPLFGVPEIVKFSVIVMVWLQMAYTLRQRHHLRSTLLLRLMPPLSRRAVDFANSLAGAGMMMLIAVYAYPEMMRAYELGVFEGERPVRVPVWPIWAVVVLGSAATAVEYAGQALQSLFADPASAGPDEDHDEGLN